jgi:hypothetical protein
VSRPDNIRSVPQLRKKNLNAVGHVNPSTARCARLIDLTAYPYRKHLHKYQENKFHVSFKENRSEEAVCTEK